MAIFNLSGGGQPVLQAKQVTPSKSQQIILPDDGYDGLSEVDIDATPLETRTVNPSTSSQTITPSSSSIGFSSVTVNPMKLQSKTITPTTLPYSVSPDSGYNGLSSVTFGTPSGLSPYNINYGVTILGVVGQSPTTYELYLDMIETGASSASVIISGYKDWWFTDASRKALITNDTSTMYVGTNVYIKIVFVPLYKEISVSIIDTSNKQGAVYYGYNLSSVTNVNNTCSITGIPLIYGNITSYGRFFRSTDQIKNPNLTISGKGVNLV